MAETQATIAAPVDEIEKIAIVGMAGRYPGAPNLESFWNNLLEGVDSLHEFSDEELGELGIPAEIYQQPNFIRRGTILPDHDRFDHELFGFSPREAAITDPQARILLETSHAALEHAGYAPFDVPGEVGVFVGCNPIDYALLLGNTDPTDSLTSFDQMIGNDRDFLATRISHRLNLRGPAINVQTACSTSLVAVHLAAQHLLDYHCSMALAGGVSLNFRQGVGYFYQPGMILSPDGVCRAFDRHANGTTLGQGCGVVVLKRLSDAIADGDTVHAVMASSALNNDGSGKISYTAPSAKGQAQVIATALAVAGLRGDDITYIETHGTGTNLGDPVEIAGLTKAFRQTTDSKSFCAIGSVKTNVGHTDAAAGITGFIKAVLAVREGKIPASLHFQEPNPAIDFTKSPFFVADRLIDWQPTTTNLRRAGVSSFGIGGTNAHAIIEQGPPTAAETKTHDRPRVIVTSAKSAAGAEASMAEAIRWSEAGRLGHDEVATLEHGRTVWPHRRAAVIVGENDSQSAPLVRRGQTAGEASTVWMFSGQGAQYPGMATGLYGCLDVFTQTLDQLLDRLEQTAELTLRPLLFADRDDAEAAERLKQTSITQPALFAVQYAMATQLQAWAVRPRAVLGHSIGEFTAATLAGILSWEDALQVVVTRGRLMQAMSPGSMIATRLSAPEYRRLLPEGVELATANSTLASVAGGPADRMEVLRQRLEEEGLEYQPLATSHAFHTAAMAPAASEFAEALQSIEWKAPRLAMLSNVSGDWLTDEQAIDPKFWASQIRQTVRFDECLAKLAFDRDLLLEVGPGRALSTFANQHEAFSAPPSTVICIGHAKEKRPNEVVALDAAARLWAEGVPLDLSAVNEIKDWRRVPAPQSVLQRHLHWAPPAKHVLALERSSAGSVLAMEPDDAIRKPRESLERWCYARSWRRSSASRSTQDQQRFGRVLLLTNETPLACEIERQLTPCCDDVITVHLADETNFDGEVLRLAAADEDGFKNLIQKLVVSDRVPQRVIHLWSIESTARPLDLPALHDGLAKGTDTLLTLARSLASVSAKQAIQIDVIATGIHDVLGGETVLPCAAAMAGPVKVIPLEYSGLVCRLTDLPVSVDPSVVSHLLQSLALPIGTDPVVAQRGQHRWVHDVDVQSLDAPAQDDLPLRHGGTYLIVGGLGGVGLSIAKYLATNFHAKLALTSRSGRPKPDSENPETTRRFERLEEIERAAQQTMILAADATNLDEMSRIVVDVEQKLGPIDGVIVAAAIADNSGAIHRRSREAATTAIAAKVHGAVVLSQVLPRRELDFVLLSSSIASQLYHNRFGQVGYVTSNSFVEAMSDAKVFRARRVVTMAWDDWVDIGMSVRAAQDFRLNHGSNIELMDEVHSFAPADGIELFQRALVAQAPTLFVSTTDLRRRIEQDFQVISPFLEQALANNDTTEIQGESIGEIVLGVWKSLLGMEQIAPDDDFFDLGGDSLQIARMADRLSRHLNQNVSLDLIFENPTLRSLIRAIEKIAGSEQRQEQLQPILGKHPLVPAQQRFLERGSPFPDHFNIATLLDVQPKVSWDDFNKAIKLLVERHDALRTRFERLPLEQDPADQAPADQADSAVENQSWFQVVLATGEQTTVTELVDLSTGNELPTVEQLGEQWQQGFQIQTGPLARFALIDLPQGKQQVFLGLHHLISDRISLLSLVDQLDILLNEEGVDALGSPTAPFSQWGVALQQYLESPQALADQSHWDRLPHLTEETWPFSGDADSGPANLNCDAIGRRLSFDRATSTAMLRGGDGRADEVILLALADALRTWSGNASIGIDVLGHGRRNLPEVDIARSVGFFLSYSPIWFTNQETQYDLPQRLEVLRRNLARGWTFDPLRYHRPSPGTTRARPRVLFNFVGRPIAGDDPRRLTVLNNPTGPGTHPKNPREHLLSAMVEISTEDLVGLTLVSNQQIHSALQIDHLESILREAIHQIMGTGVPGEGGTLAASDHNG